MADLIEMAISQLQGTKIGKVDIASEKVTKVIPKLSDFPTDKDPDVIERQLEAKALQKKALADELLLKAKEMAIEEAKRKLLSLAGSSLKIPPKLPLLDPKLLGAVELLKQAKQLTKEKQKKVKKNLDDGRKLFKYDLKKIKNLNQNFESVDLPFI